MRLAQPQSLVLLAAVGFVGATSQDRTKRLTHMPYKRQNQETELVSSSWFAGWYADSVYTLDDVHWDKYTHLYYAFLLTTEDPGNFTLAQDDANVMSEFVQKAHENDVKAMISVGGWSGSRFFSTGVGDEKNRTAFADGLVKIVEDNGFDGIDFDWEYPNRQGIGCNTISSNDTANFLTFLQELRNNHSDYILTADGSLFPWNDETGNQATDLSGFADVLDWITIMDYDVWGSWSTAVGPNSPLNDTCVPTEYQQGSAASGVANWTAAGIPANKIILGVASYGHSYYVNSTAAFDGDQLAAYPPFDSSKRPRGDNFSDEAGIDVCGNESAAGDTWYFRSLFASGYLNADGTAAEGIPHRFDNCSQTDYVYNTTSSVMISYDSPQAFAAKGEFIKDEGLRGFGMWVSVADPNTVLVDAIREAAGFSNCEVCHQRVYHALAAS